jgi:hypothetical protein
MAVRLQRLFALVILALWAMLAACLVISADMSAAGAVVNASGYLVAIIAIGTQRPSWILLYGAMSLLVGPFMLPFQALLGDGGAEFARLDYFMGFAFVVLYLVRHQAVKRTFWFLFVAAMAAAFLHEGLAKDGGVRLDVVADYVGTLGRLAFAWVLCVAFINAHKDRSGVDDWIFWAIVALLAAHVALSVLQFKYSIGIRGGAAEAGLTILGRQVNRPTGLLEGAYLYGAVSIFVLAICRPFIEGSASRQRLWSWLFGAILLIACVSSRSVLLALVVYLAVRVYARLVRPGLRVWVALPLLSLLGVLALQNYWTIVQMDESNGTKLAMWALVVSDMVSGSSWQQLLFGHGVNMASQVSAGLADFMASLDVSAGLDSRATSGEGFPIHNIYLQALYEFGFATFAVFGMATAAFLVRAWKQGVFWAFLALMMVVNYLLHNGIFAVPLLASMMIVMGKARHGTRD